MGRGPSEFDCSCLTMWAYRAARIFPPHSSRSQRTLGRAASKGALQPGDLVFFDDGSGDAAAIHHVGITSATGRWSTRPPKPGGGRAVGDRRSATAVGRAALGQRRLQGGVGGTGRAEVGPGFLNGAQAGFLGGVSLFNACMEDSFLMSSFD
jgi:cell wall-associated NlpC family hydrolase